MPLVKRIARTLARRSTDPVEDITQVGSLGLIKAVDSYKLDKNIKLATYASRCIENEILMYLRKKSKMRIEVSLDEPLSQDDEGNELLLSDVLSNDVYEVNETLLEQERQEKLRKGYSEVMTEYSTTKINAFANIVNFSLASCKRREKML